MKIRRSMIMLILAMCAVLVFAACSNNNDGGNNESANGNDNNNTTVNNDGEGNAGNDNEGEEKPSYWVEEPTELTMMYRDSQSWPYSEDWKMWEWFREETNLTFDVSVPPGNYDDALNLNLASGTLADVLPNLSTGWSVILGSDGGLIDMNEHMDKMPHVQAYREQNPAEFSKHETPEGKLYIVPATTGATITDHVTFFYRQDVFEEHNLDVPTNWDEVYEVATELKSIYPDSYPLLTREINRINRITNTFGVPSGYFYDKDEQQAVYAPTTDAYKEAVIMLNKFYDEGLIPPNYLSVTYDEWQQYLATDRAFITHSYIGQKEIMNNAIEEEGVWLEYMSPPNSDLAEGVIQSPASAAGFAVSSQTENLEAALKYIDFLYSERGQELSSWGKEGETYEVVDGEKQYFDKYTEFTQLRREEGIMTSGTFLNFDPNAVISAVAEDERPAYDRAMEDAAGPDHPIQMNTQPVWLDEEADIYNQYHPSISTYMEENIARFIVGERSLDEWDDYIAGYENLNLDAVLDIYTDGFQRIFE